MKRLRMVRVALMIICALCMNTAFGQNVRTKPVVKKQTTTTKKTTTTTKKTTVKKKTTKKKTYYYDDYYDADSAAYAAYLDSVEYANSATASDTPQLSESATMLGTLLLYPLGTIDINMLDKNNSYNTIAAAIKQKYTLSSTSDTKHLWIYANENPGLNFNYHGLPFYNFCIDSAQNYSWHRDLLYTFEISKGDMTRGLYDYLDLIVSDLHELGFPITYQKKNDKYLKAEGSIKVGDLEIKIEINDYSVYQYEIRVYLY